MRVEGAVERIDAVESDAYFAGRPRDSQLGAWASQQSAELEARSVLEARIGEVERTIRGPSRRPSSVLGRIPDRARDRIEFWYGRAGRLHERLLYTKTPDAWKTSWLFP